MDTIDCVVVFEGFWQDLAVFFVDVAEWDIDVEQGLVLF